MLTSSPVAPRPTSASASASPRELRYAPIPRSPSTRSPHQSPNITASLRRRHSKHSVSQPSPQPPPSGPAKPPLHPEPKQYVGVDAATQYSPMEPFDPTVPLRAADASAPRKPTSAPTPVVKEPEPPAESNGESTQKVKSVSQPLSPAKRRNSQDHGLVSAIETPLPSPPKRTRANVPVKILPVRYEKCDVEDMVILIANMIGELIETNDSLGMKSGNLTRFHSRYHGHALSSSPFTFKSQRLTRLPAGQRQASLSWIISSDLQSTPR